MGEAMTARRAGQHARETTRRLARRALVAIGAMVLVGVVVGIEDGFLSLAFGLAEVGTYGGLLLIDRVVLPVVDRWDRGAEGEEHVGAILDALASEGWLAIHDVTFGHGNIDHVLIGPGGLLTVETKSHRGRIAVDRLDERMLRQAYAQAKALERVTGRAVAPLLVFSRAYLDRPVTRQRGVTVLPARMLAGHLARRQGRLSADEVTALHARLAAAVD
jgi:hypothetical protein